VADLSRRLYVDAEAAIREHPEAWTAWTYPSMLAPDLLGGADVDLGPLPAKALS